MLNHKEHFLGSNLTGCSFLFIFLYFFFGGGRGRYDFIISFVSYFFLSFYLFIYFFLIFNPFNMYKVHI